MGHVQARAADTIEQHHLAGLDERGRGFNRLLALEQVDGRYRASFRYEALVVVTEPVDRPEEALAQLVRTLQGRGFTQLRSRPSFRGGAYLGTQECWVEYPDGTQPAGATGALSRAWARLRRQVDGWFGRSP